MNSGARPGNEQSTMTPTILCPVDFSAHSRRALRYGSQLAARSRGGLTVLFVEDPLLFAATAGGREGAATRQLRARLETFVRNAIGPRGMTSHPRVTLEIAVGNAAREIQDASRRLRCNVIVMGSHGLTGATRLLLGSTTEQVLRRAPVPVLAIPPTRRRNAGFSRILAGARQRR